MGTDREVWSSGCCRLHELAESAPKTRTGVVGGVVDGVVGGVVGGVVYDEVGHARIVLIFSGGLADASIGHGATE